MEDTEGSERTSDYLVSARAVGLFEGELPGGDRPPEAVSSRRSSAIFGCVPDLAQEAPILHFASGSQGKRAHRALMRAWNARDYEAARALFHDRELEFTRFQRHAVRFLFAVLEESPKASRRSRASAEDEAEEPHEKAALHENDAFTLLRAGRFTEARGLCEEALAIYPTTEGLWINLLVSLSRLDESAAIDSILRGLPRILDLERGLLGLYLTHDPSFRAAVCNGG
jgi:hypothetical protein